MTRVRVEIQIKGVDKQYIYRKKVIRIRLITFFLKIKLNSLTLEFYSQLNT